MYYKRFNGTGDRMKWSLKNKIVLPSILIVILGVSVSTLISYRYAKSAITHLVESQLESQVDSTTHRLGDWLENRCLDVENFATNAMLTKSLIYDGLRDQANLILAETLKSHSDYEFIALVNIGGNIVASSDKALTGKVSISGRPFFQETLHGKIAFSEIVKSNNTGEPVLMVSGPILENGKVNGAVIVSLIINKMSEKFILPINVGETGYAYVSDNTGRVIAHPDPKKILNLDISGSEFGKAFRAREKGFVHYDWEGHVKIAGFGRISKTGWTIAIGTTEKEIFAPVAKMGLVLVFLGIVLVFLIGLATWLLVGRFVVKPVNSVAAGLKDLAQGEGDLTFKLNISSNDEISELGMWFDTFLGQLREIIARVASNSDAIEKSSVDLTQISRELSSNADEANMKSADVAKASDEVNININQVSAAMEQSAANANMVAAAAEEMTATIGEVAQGANRASQISSTAVSEAREASQMMEQLERAAKEIDGISETITDISEQTNLLALNATIEAARAGEAGKGFGVVANEIKSLALQTADATNVIKNKINDIQTSTGGAVQGITHIEKVIGEINGIITTIASSVEEQSATTTEIATNISQVSSGVGDVNDNMMVCSTVISGMVSDISEVNNASEEISGRSAHVDESSRALMELADRLKGEVARFKI
jgi:methyl-accepting chemotaxis protein